ncbi:response regulator [Chitinibacteraceae bacterium HSL-7]
MSAPSAVVIDDDRILRSTVTSILRSAGVDVVGDLGHADGAMALCQQIKPQLVVLDIHLGDGDGLTLLPQLRGLDPPPVVIMISSDATLEHVKRALGLGAAGFVVKPVTAAKLLDAASRALHRSLTVG